MSTPRAEIDRLLGLTPPQVDFPSLVRSAATKLNLPLDVADDYLRVIGGIESGNKHYRNGEVLRSDMGALGGGQLTPDRPGTFHKTVKGRVYDLRDPEQNAEAGLSYFSSFGDDPIARRIGYFSGDSKSLQHYRNTGRIPMGGERDPRTGLLRTSFHKYISATGGFDSVKPSRDTIDAALEMSPTGDKPTYQVASFSPSDEAANSATPTPAPAPAPAPQKPLQFLQSVVKTTPVAPDTASTYKPPEPPEKARPADELTSKPTFDVPLKPFDKEQTGSLGIIGNAGKKAQEGYIDWVRRNANGKPESLFSDESYAQTFIKIQQYLGDNPKAKPEDIVKELAKFGQEFVGDPATKGKQLPKALHDAMLRADYSDDELKTLPSKIRQQREQIARADQKRQAEAALQQQTYDLWKKNPQKLSEHIAWHFGRETLDQLSNMPEKAQRQVALMAVSAANEDERKRRAGQTEFQQDPTYQASMRQKIGISDEMLRAQIPSRAAEQPRTAFAANPMLATARPTPSQEADAKHLQEIENAKTRAFEARSPSWWEKTGNKISELIDKYAPGIANIDRPMGIKSDPVRGALHAVTLGALGDERKISKEEMMLDPNAKANAGMSYEAGGVIGSLLPLIAVGKGVRLASAAIGLKIPTAIETAATFGLIDAGHQTVAAARGKPVDWTSPPLSAGLGFLMEGLAGENPNIVRRVIAFVAPTLVLDIAKGTPPSEAAKNSLVNAGFALTAGGKREEISPVGDKLAEAGKSKPETAPTYELIGKPVTPVEREAIYRTVEDAQAGNLENSRIGIAEALKKQHGGSLSDWFGKMNTLELESRQGTMPAESKPEVSNARSEPEIQPEGRPADQPYSASVAEPGRVGEVSEPAGVRPRSQPAKTVPQAEDVPSSEAVAREDVDRALGLMEEPAPKVSPPQEPVKPEAKAPDGPTASMPSEGGILKEARTEEQRMDEAIKQIKENPRAKVPDDLAARLDRETWAYRYGDGWFLTPKGENVATGKGHVWTIAEWDASDFTLRELAKDGITETVRRDAATELKRRAEPRVEGGVSVPQGSSLLDRPIARSETGEMRTSVRDVIAGIPEDARRKLAAIPDNLGGIKTRQAVEVALDGVPNASAIKSDLYLVRDRAMGDDPWRNMFQAVRDFNNEGSKVSTAPQEAPATFTKTHQGPAQVAEEDMSVKNPAPGVTTSVMPGDAEPLVRKGVERFIKERGKDPLAPFRDFEEQPTEKLKMKVWKDRGEEFFKKAEAATEKIEGEADYERAWREIERTRNLPQEAPKTAEPAVSPTGDKRPKVPDEAPPRANEATKLGPGAANVGDVPAASTMAQLSEAIGKMPKGKRARETTRAALDAADQVSQGKDAIVRGLARMKAIGESLLTRPIITDYKKAAGEFLFAAQKSDHETRLFAKQLQKQVPSKLRREAITNFIQAGGDSAVLAERAKSSKLRMKLGYEEAQHLTDEEKTIATNIMSYYDSRWREAHDAGILNGVIENYVNQAWMRRNPITDKLMADVQRGLLEPNFKYARQRVFESFFEGEQAGYKPLTKDVGALLSMYNQALDRAIFSRQFVRSLYDLKASDGDPLVALSGSGVPVPKGEEPPQQYSIRPHAKQVDLLEAVRRKKADEPALDLSRYQVVDHPALRGWKWLTNATSPKLTEAGELDINPQTEAPKKDYTPIYMKGDMLVHPEAYDHLNNMLKRRWLSGSGKLQAAARGVMRAQTTVKQTMFSLSGFHQVQEGIHALGHQINPVTGRVKLDFDDPSQSLLIKRGLQVASFDGLQEFSEGLTGGNLANKIPIIGPRILQPYQDYLFRDFIPELKMTMALKAFKRNTKRYSKSLDTDQIAELTAEQSNAAFGELNYRYMGRNPNYQDMARAFLLAPDFLEARARFVGQATKPYGREQLVALGLLAATQYTASRLLNKLLDGDYHWEPENAFRVMHNKRWYGVRSVPADIIHLVSDPRSFFYHRLSPALSLGVEGITGRDDRGQKINAAKVIQDFKDHPLRSVTNLPGTPIVLRQREDDAWWESFANSIGLQEGKYHTPAEEVVRDYYNEKFPGGFPKSDNPEHAELKKQLVKKERAGENVEDDILRLGEEGKLSPDEAKQLFKKGQLDSLQASIVPLPLATALNVYEKADKGERERLQPILAKKARAWLKRTPAKERGDLAERIDKVLK